mmetsp:Transcript_4580/g.10033  ORF Transcript_4580/g.10033 Transcript_4580/m.10033 type:complete len:85 (+) Transcript_4580:40-294(+)
MTTYAWRKKAEGSPLWSLVMFLQDPFGPGMCLFFMTLLLLTTISQVMPLNFYNTMHRIVFGAVFLVMSMGFIIVVGPSLRPQRL